jgi:hypothetical protein
MFELKAKDLKVGDEFTTDDGATWYTARGFTARRGRMVVATDNDVLLLNPNDKVIVR